MQDDHLPRPRERLTDHISSSSRFPFSISIALTHRCNLSCPHCYLPKTLKGEELSTQEVNQLLGNLAQLGVLRLQFTGGEPTIRTDLFELISHAVDLRFAVVLKSNATLLSYRDIDRLYQIGLPELHASLYHMNPDKHDRFVGSKGAWRRTVDSLFHFQKAGGRVRAGIVVMNWNLDGILALEQFCRKNKWHYTPDFTIQVAMDGNTAPASLRANGEDILRIYRQSHHFQKEQRDDHPGRNRFEAPLCGAARTVASVLPNGDIVPCDVHPWVLGNIRQETFERIWLYSAGRKRLLGLERKKTQRCAQCQYIWHCNPCPAASLQEEGDCLIPTARQCEMAEIRYRAKTGNDP